MAEKLLASPYKELKEAYQDCDREAILQFAAEICAQDRVRLPHPEDGTCICECIGGVMRDWSNILLFADSDRRNRWALIQAGSFINTLVTESDQYHIAAGGQGQIDKWVTRYRDGKLNWLWDAQQEFGGLSVFSDRPYHFLYDQLINVPEIADKITGELSVAHADNEHFFDAAKIYDNVRTLSIDPQKYYVLPNILYSFPWRRWKPQEFFSYANALEDAITQKVERSELPGALNLWVGITGQKRSWLEQETGIPKIVKRLAERFGTVHVLVDGITAPDRQIANVPEDSQVAGAIIDEVARSCDNVTCETLVGQDYWTKIAYCAGTDAFIANAGSGCIVPLRFCKKPGVLHSNRWINTFTGDQYPSGVITIDQKYVEESAVDGDVPKACVSYSINWEFVYTALLKSLQSVP